MIGVIKDMAVFLDPEPSRVLACGLAARLAERWQAHLIAVFAVPEISVNPWIRGKAIPDALDRYLEAVKQEEQDARADFEKICESHGIAGEWRSQRIEPPEDVIVHARYAALSVVVRSDAEETPLVGLPERLVLASGRPTLLVPPTFDPQGLVGHRIVLAWNASQEAARAVWDAMPLLSAADVVEVLIVDHDRYPDRFGEEPGADLACHLARYGVEVNVRTISSKGGDVGTLLLDTTMELSADLLVLGAYSHARFTEAIFGGVTRRVLREAKMPTLMSR
ncbi:MAG TPA: universal stress protein [Myxococcota bacterium]|nr:universal stress protein [Myxococcota bacterium]